MVHFEMVADFELKQDISGQKTDFIQQKPTLSPSPLWRKIQKEFLYNCCKLLELNPLDFSKQDSDGNKILRDFCSKKLLSCCDLEIPEGMAFVILLEGKSSVEALSQYEQLSSRPVIFSTLRHHARSACNKVLKCLETNRTTLMEELEKRLRNEGCN